MVAYYLLLKAARCIKSGGAKKKVPSTSNSASKATVQSTCERETQRLAGVKVLYSMVESNTSSSRKLTI